MTPEDRERLGRLVRDIIAETRPGQLPWEQCWESNREAWRNVGERLYNEGWRARGVLEDTHREMRGQL